MSLLDFLLRHIHITSELANLDLKVRKSRLEFSNYFRCQSFQGSYIDYLELLQRHILCSLLMIGDVVLDFRKNSQHSNISFTGTCWSRDQ